MVSASGHPGPLSGVRILDAATLLAAPTAASLLSEYGASIIKIEQPRIGDTMRSFPPYRGDVSLLWKVIGRNRQCITLDLRADRGRELLKDLARNSDVVVVNYRPETLAKWGIDFDDLVAVNPRLIMLHLTAYGRTGPYAQKPGFARVAEAFAGLTHRTGFPGQEPVQSGYPMLGDGVAGLYGAFAILLAIRQRDLTGEPQLIDLGLYEPLLRLIEDQIAAYDEDGTVLGRIGNANPMISPNGLFPTRDGRWVSIPASTEPIWRRLVALMGQEQLLKYDTNKVRLDHRPEVDARVTEWTMSHDLMDIVDLCAEAGIACGPVYSAAEIAQDPHLEYRESLISLDDEETGRSVRMASPAGRFSGFEAEVRETGPMLGAHTDDVLRDVLGLTVEEIDELRTSGVI